MAGKMSVECGDLGLVLGCCFRVWRFIGGALKWRDGLTSDASLCFEVIVLGQSAQIHG